MNRSPAASISTSAQTPRPGSQASSACQARGLTGLGLGGLGLTGLGLTGLGLGGLSLGGLSLTGLGLGGLGLTGLGLGGLSRGDSGCGLGGWGRHRPASSSSTAASAATPASQSARSACSAGEWDTPVGLRTKSMAVGSLAASTPASWPAPVASTGAAVPRAASALASRARNAGSNSTGGVNDSLRMLTSTPWAAAARRAVASIWPTT